MDLLNKTDAYGLIGPNGFIVEVNNGKGIWLGLGRYGQGQLPIISLPGQPLW